MFSFLMKRWEFLSHGFIWKK